MTAGVDVPGLLPGVALYAVLLLPGHRVQAAVQQHHSQQQQQQYHSQQQQQQQQQHHSLYGAGRL